MNAEQLRDEAERRSRGWLPLDKWGPVCAGCGADEYRLDGYCSLECRDFHSDDETAAVYALAADMADALEQISRAVHEYQVLARLARGTQP